MATSLRDLVDSAHGALRDEDCGIGEAAAALGKAARLLDRLLESSERAKATRIRDSLIHSLARPCERAANTWPCEAGRADALLGATIDAVGVFRDQLSADDRWALALRTASIARRAANLIRTAGPYEQAPTLNLAISAADQLRRLGASNPPHPDRLCSLDSPIPIGHTPIGLGAAETVIELTASLVHELNQPSSAPLSMRQLIAAARAGEAIAASVSSGVDPTVARSVQADLVERWTALRQALAQFTDGQPPRSWDGTITPTVVQLCRALADASPGAPQFVAAALERIVDWLPLVGEGIEWQWHRLDRPLLMPPGRAPADEARVSAWLRRETVIVGSAERLEVRRLLGTVTLAAARPESFGDGARAVYRLGGGSLGPRQDVRLHLL